MKLNVENIFPEQKELDLTAEVAELVKEYEARLLRYAARLLRNSETARDAVQEAFIRFVRISREGKRHEIENIQAWLYRVTRNLCLDELKSKRSGTEINVDFMEFANSAEFADNESPDKAMEKNEAMRIVREQISKLEPREREILVLKLDHGRSYKEIADIMNLSVGNVGFILHTTMKKLAEAIKSMQKHEDAKVKI